MNDLTAVEPTKPTCLKEEVLQQLRMADGRVPAASLRFRLYHFPNPEMPVLIDVLDELVNENLIEKFANPGERTLYWAHEKGQVAPKGTIRRDDTTDEKILKALIRPMNTAELLTATGLAYPTLMNHLKSLEKRGKVIGPPPKVKNKPWSSTDDAIKKLQETPLSPTPDPRVEKLDLPEFLKGNLKNKRDLTDAIDFFILGLERIKKYIEAE